MTPGSDRDRGGRLSVAWLGLAIGVALGFAAAFGGFEAFALVLLLGGLGLVIGLAIDGRIDPVSWFDRDRRDRSDRR